MPLSFLILISGCITIFGTSSNLIVQGLLNSHKLEPMDNFEILPVALPASLACLLYFLIVVPRLFSHFAKRCQDETQNDSEIQRPENDQKTKADRIVRLQKTKRFVTGLQIQTQMPTPFVEHSLHNIVECINDITLVERMGQQLVPAVPEHRAHLAKELVVDNIWDGTLRDFDVVHIHSDPQVLAQIRELPSEEGVSVLSVEQNFHVARGERELVEVVIDGLCPLHGKSLAYLDSSASYSDVRVLASRPMMLQTPDWNKTERRELVRKYLAKYRGEAGYSLKVGDGLLLDCPSGWSRGQQGSTEFFTVRMLSSGEDAEEDSKGEEYTTTQVVWSGLIFILMIISVSTNTMELLQSALLATFSLTCLGCVTPKQAYQAVNLRTLISIVGAFGLGKALGKTGVAAVMAGGLVAMLGPFGAVGLHTGLFLGTVALGIIFHATAVVILMFPVAATASDSMGLPLHQVLCTVMIGAGCQMLSPVSYQTNMMVYAYGDYSFQDFPRLGVGAVAIIGLVSIPLTIQFID